MTPQIDVRALARERLIAGQVPTCDVARLYAGRGTLSQCAVCLRPIEPQHVEYEIAVARNPGEWLHMHVACYEAWQSESQRLLLACDQRIAERGDPGHSVA